MNISVHIPDTHKAIEALQQRGTTKEVAEGIIEVLQSAKLSSDPATKDDVMLIRSDVEQLRAEMYRALLVHGFTTVGAIIAAAAVLVGG